MSQLFALGGSSTGVLASTSVLKMMVSKNLLSNAGDVGLIPGQGTKIPPYLGAAKPTRHNKDVVQPKIK